MPCGLQHREVDLGFLDLLAGRTGGLRRSGPSAAELKPRLGSRRWMGIWPPSKPILPRPPVRARWPLWPRPAVLPRPEPMPRPTRTRTVLAPLAGLMLVEQSHFRPLPTLNMNSEPRTMPMICGRGGDLDGTGDGGAGPARARYCGALANCPCSERSSVSLIFLASGFLGHGGLQAENFFDRLAALGGDVGRQVHALQRVHGGAHQVDRVARAEDLATARSARQPLRTPRASRRRRSRRYRPTPGA